MVQMASIYHKTLNRNRSGKEDKQKSKGRCEYFISSKSVLKLEFYQVTLLNATKNFAQSASVANWVQ